MVSRMTAGLLTEKALHGALSGLHRTGLRGKLRLYACRMTEASWKDPVFTAPNMISSERKVLWSQKKLQKPTSMWQDRIDEMMRPHISIGIRGLWCPQPKTEMSSVTLCVLQVLIFSGSELQFTIGKKKIGPYRDMVMVFL